MSGWSDQEAHPLPEVVQVFPRGGAAQAPHDYEVVRVVPWVPGGHVLKDLEI